MTPDEIEAKIATLGRPESVFAPLSALRANIATKLAWDLAHPAEAAEYFRLVGQLHEAQRDAEAHDLEERRSSKLLELLGAAGVGERTVTATNAPDDTQALNAVRRWLKGKRTWCVLLGRPGVGKTVAAVWALREALSDGHTAAFRRTGAVSRLSQFDAGADEMRRLSRVQLLVLDDYGTEHASEYAKAQLYQLLDTRHEERLRTVLTTNLSREQFRAHAGDRLVDRIAGDGLVVELNGVSLRRREAA